MSALSAQGKPRTIIVPLDGSEVAEQALPYALALAGHHAGTLVLISIIDIPTEFGSWSIAASVGMAHTLDDWVADSKRYLDSVKARFSQPTATSIVQVGSAAAEVRRAAATYENPLIVMTSHGRSGAKRLLLGSVTTKLVHDAGCPVLVIRRSAGVSTTDSVSLRRVLVPLDGSSFGEEALQQAISAFDDHLTFHLLRVAEQPVLPTMGLYDGGIPLDYGLVGEYVEAVKDEALAYLPKIQGELEAQGHVVTWEVAEGEPAIEILRVADEQSSDVIAMATHGRGGFSRIVFGSVAERVLQEASQPLLLIRPNE